MASIAVNAVRLIGAVNPYHGGTEADPVLAEWIVRPRFDLIHHLLSLCFLFALNRPWHAPSRILAHLDHHERSDRSLPLLAWLPNCNRIYAAEFTVFKMKKYSLWQIDLDRIRFLDAYDMTVVYMDSVPRMETVANLFAVVAS
jgi:hypothetical protein